MSLTWFMGPRRWRCRLPLTAALPAPALLTPALLAPALLALAVAASRAAGVVRLADGR